MGWMGRRVDGTRDVESRGGECADEGWIGGLVDRSTGQRFDGTGHAEDEQIRGGY